MKPADLETVRQAARDLFGESTKPKSGVTRKDYVASVVREASNRLGASDTVTLHAERVARHMWDSSGR